MYRIDEPFLAAVKPSRTMLAFLLGWILPGDGSADVSHETRGRRLMRVGYLSHANSSAGDDEPEILGSSGG
jgi:hypothetical protein